MWGCTRARTLCAGFSLSAVARSARAHHATGASRNVLGCARRAAGHAGARGGRAAGGGPQGRGAGAGGGRRRRRRRAGLGGGAAVHPARAQRGGGAHGRVANAARQVGAHAFVAPCRATGRVPERGGVHPIALVRSFTLAQGWWATCHGPRTDGCGAATLLPLAPRLPASRAGAIGCPPTLRPAPAPSRAAARCGSASRPPRGPHPPHPAPRPTPRPPRPAPPPRARLRAPPPRRRSPPPPPPTPTLRHRRRSSSSNRGRAPPALRLMWRRPWTPAHRRRTRPALARRSLSRQPRTAPQEAMPPPPLPLAAWLRSPAMGHGTCSRRGTRCPGRRQVETPLPLGHPAAGHSRRRRRQRWTRARCWLGTRSTGPW